MRASLNQPCQRSITGLLSRLGAAKELRRPGKRRSDALPAGEAFLASDFPVNHRPFLHVVLTIMRGHPAAASGGMRQLRRLPQARRRALTAPLLLRQVIDVVVGSKQRLVPGEGFMCEVPGLGPCTGPSAWGMQPLAAPGPAGLKQLQAKSLLRRPETWLFAGVRHRECHRRSPCCSSWCCVHW
jgi:hypothetical protein